VMFRGDSCQACLNFERRKEINWEAREKELKDILDEHRGKKPYDCAIAISGGKDSHWIVNKLEELDMHPLLLTVMDRFTHTKAGQHNFNNLLKKYNNIMYTINMDTFVKSTRWAFEQLGQPLKYTEYLIYLIPYDICIALDIPLLFFGENSAYEYGQTDTDQYIANGQIRNLVEQMVDEAQWWEEGGITLKELFTIDMRQTIDVNRRTPLAIYMSYFYPWSSVGHLETAQRMGFKTLEGEWDREGCCENFEQIDSYGYVAHLWMRYPRLGYQRVTDIATRRVREGVWTLEEAQKIIKERDHIMDRQAYEDFISILGYPWREYLDLLNDASWNKYYGRGK
ncbi:hypothetical protein LCGC14_2550320, partial [marine sediment metagenome]